MERMPVFIKVDEYDNVLELVRIVKQKMEEAKEDHQLEMWQNALSEVEKKIDLIDHSLNEPEQF